MTKKIIGVDIDKVLTNNTALISTLITPKGDRKTTGIKNKMFDDFKNGQVSLYMRRYKTQVTTNANDFYGEIIPHYPERYDGWQFRKGKHVIEASDDGKVWRTVCYVYAMSQIDTLKSQINITNLHNIYYDECIPMDARYLKDEMKLCLELWKTVDRDRVLNPNVQQTKMLLCGNEITPYNPFYDFFNINASNLHKGFNYFNNGRFCAIKLVNKGNQRLRSLSPFDELVKGTQFEEYEHGGTLNGLTFQQMPLLNAQPYCNISEGEKHGTIYINNGRFIVSNKIVSCSLNVTFDENITNGNTANLKYSSIRQVFRVAKSRNFFFFTDSKSYADFRKTISLI